LVLFFFQAEDGIRDFHVTGVQTCALPISDCLLGEEGTPASAHEFHSSTVSPTHDARPLWNIDGTPAGFAGPTLAASYLHVHWAGHTDHARRFVDAVRVASVHRGAPAPPVDGPVPDPVRH